MTQSRRVRILSSARQLTRWSHQKAARLCCQWAVLFRGGASFGLIIALGCAGSPTPLSVTPDAQGLWDQAETARIAGQHSEAAELYSSFHRYHYRDPRSAEALLNAGVEYRQAGQPSSAREYLIAATTLTNPRIKPYAQLQLGYLERSEGQYAAAAMRFAESANSAFESETKAEALLEAGFALQRAGAFDEATRPLTAVVNMKDISPRFASEARQALKQPSYFTVQVGAFASNERAANLLSGLKSDRFSGRIEIDNSGPQQLYRVYCGQFARRPEVEAHAQKLSAKGYSVLIRP